MLACLNHSNALSSNLNVVLLSHACLDCSTCTCWCLFVGLSSTSLIVLPQLQHRLGSIGGIGIQLGSALLNLNIIVVISLFPVLHLSSLLADLSSLMVAVSLSRLRSTSIILSSVHCSVLIVATRLCSIDISLRSSPTFNILTDGTRRLQRTTLSSFLIVSSGCQHHFESIASPRP